jgi:hypothetical protein
MNKHYLLLVLLFYSLHIVGQEKINLDLHSKYVFSSTSGLQPFYQHSNQWGLLSGTDESHAFVLGKLKWKILSKQNATIEAGISGVAKTKWRDSFLHESYIKGSLWNFLDLFAGKIAYTPLSYNDELTAGGFLMNSNARPLPRITAGIFNYSEVPFLKGWVEVKGGISHGWLNDDRIVTERNNSAEKTLLHEKWAYLRLGRGKYQPYVGLVHSSIYGGIRPSGNKIPIDFLATFFARGSEKIGGGEATNAAGAHEGFWDLGINTENSVGKFHLYFQKPFADGSGMNIWWFKNKDFRLGILSELRDISWLKEISVEYLKTDHQSGAGIPDPVYPEGHPNVGQIIWLNQIEDYDIFMKETFGLEVDGYTKADVKDYLIQNLNNGYKYGGRDDYNNNGTYYNGWSYYHQNIGLPLYHSYSLTRKYEPDFTGNNSAFFTNTRIRALHFGFKGSLNKGLNYIVKFSASQNFGSYSDEYKRRYSWQPTDDYIFKGGKSQLYSLLSFNYQNKKWKQLCIEGSFAYDTGELYNVFGCMIGVIFNARY